MSAIVTITIVCITTNSSNLKLNKLKTITTMFYFGNIRYRNVETVIIVCITINILNHKLIKLEIVVTSLLWQL